MKLNRKQFLDLCAEVISNITDDAALSNDSKIMVMMIGMIVSGRITGKLFSEDEEIEIVSDSSGCEDK